MTGNVSTTGQVLGASTTAGAGVALLPNTSGNSVFRYFLIATIAVCAGVLLMRIAKLASVKLSR
jgi:hypothetical protein